MNRSRPILLQDNSGDSMTDNPAFKRETQTSEEDDSVTPYTTDIKYGWLIIKPKPLQGCLSSKWILFFCCFLVAAQGFIVTGLSGVVISSIEKRYHFQSREVGTIFACYDIGNTILTILVSYFGHRHKSRWLGVGAFVLGIGCLVFALPQALISNYKPTETQLNDILCLDDESFYGNLTGGLSTQRNCKTTQWYNRMVFIIGQLLVGAGASPVYNLGTTYLDENTSHQNSGLYLGIFYAVATLGPGIGYLLGGYFLTIYVDIHMPAGVNLKQEDNGWIGAWWLGYVFGGSCALIASIPLLGFPQVIPSQKKVQEAKQNALDTVPDEKKSHTIKQFLPSLKSLFTNKVFLFTTIGGTAEGFAVSGTSTFLAKYLQSQFHLKSSNASFYTGIAVIPGGILAMLLGGYLIKRLNWTCEQCIKACTIIAFIAMFPILIYIVHCPNLKIAGVTVPYHNRSSLNDSNSDVCSKTQNCTCNQYKYIPVCSKQDGITYFSPCHAGCTTQTTLEDNKVYTNCSCLPPNITVVHDGGCSKTCNAISYFMVVIFFLIVLTFFNNIPALTVTLRCVPESQGSFALGIQQIITRILAFIPAPIVYGALLDSVCILSETDPCDNNTARNCLEYQNERLSKVFLGATMLCKFLSFTFFGLAWFVYKPPKHNQESQIDLVDARPAAVITKTTSPL